MSGDSVSGFDNLEERVCVWRFAFEFDRQGREEQDLDCGAAGIPERP